MIDAHPFIVLIGTKAQFIKTAPILREFDKRNVPYRLVYTGQHSETFDLLEAAFGTRGADDNFVPHFEASTHGGFARWTFAFWRAAIRRIRRGEWRSAPFGIVHGDTASTLFGALALRLAGVPVAHVEAGLRSSKLMEPFPEEIVRRIVSRLTKLHLAPDARAASNLEHAGGVVVNTGGNTLRDALALALRKLSHAGLVAGSGGYLVASMHRSENLGRKADFDMLMEEFILAARHSPIKFVLHPATREKIRASGWRVRLQQTEGIELMDRMDYPDFVKLLVGSNGLMTDGGSNQEEAAMLGLPTLLLRRTTERHDGLGDNALLSGLRPEAIRMFVADRAGKHWVVRAVVDGSPSAIVVDALTGVLRADG